ncbi:ABC transporter substrate-binding protein [Thermodesulfobacteriota bacterium]
MKKSILGSILVLIFGLGLSSTLWAEVGVTDTEIVVGSEQDLSGPIAFLGGQIKNGLDMKIKEINEAGGIHGRKLRLVVGDHAYDPKKAIMLTNKLINRDKVFCFVSILGTAPAVAVKPIITKKKIPFLFPVSASENAYTPFNRYAFALVVPYRGQGAIMVKYGVKTKGYKKFGLMYQDDDFGVGVLNGMKQQLSKYNLKLLAAESYKRGATDFSSQMAKLKRADVDVVALATVVRETVGAMKEISKMGWDVPLLAASPASSAYVPVLAKKAGISSDGMQVLNSYPDISVTDLPAVKEWRKRYVKAFGKPPGMYVITGYDWMNFFRIALEKAGRDLTRETLVDALETFKDVPSILGGPAVTFSPTKRLGTNQFFVALLQGGKLWKISEWISMD